MSLHPNFREAFEEGIRYLDLGDDEEKREKQQIIEKLKFRMDEISQTTAYQLGTIFKNLDSILDHSGLEVDENKKRDIKRRALDNIKNSL